MHSKKTTFMITDAILKFVPFSPEELNDALSRKEYVQKKISCYYKKARFAINYIL
jgi:hypothetical protein